MEYHGSPLQAELVEVLGELELLRAQGALCSSEAVFAAYIFPGGWG